MKAIKFLILYAIISRAENKINSNYLTNFNKSKRVALWCLAYMNKGLKLSVSSNYAFHKVYHFLRPFPLIDIDRIVFIIACIFSLFGLAMIIETLIK